MYFRIFFFKNYSYLDSEKSKVYFLSWLIVEKNTGHTRHKTLNKEKPKITIFKANFTPE
jgi:hypothetical protein